MEHWDGGEATQTHQHQSGKISLRAGILCFACAILLTHISWVGFYHLHTDCPVLVCFHSELINTLTWRGGTCQPLCNLQANISLRPVSR